MLTRKAMAIITCLLFGSFLLIPVRGQIVPPGASDTGLGGGNAITGSVLLSTGGRLERRVTIRLQTTTRGDRVASTDEYGNFAFRGLVSGDYTLVIDKEKDFEPLSQNVSIMQVRGFPAQTYNFSLRIIPKAAAQPKPGVVDAALANLPERGRSLFSRSQELARSGDHNGAVEQLKQLNAEFPNFMQGFNELGVEYLRLTDFSKADEAFLAAIKIEPDAFAPIMNRGIALFSLKKYAEAESVLTRALKLNSDSPVVHYFLGQTLANLGRFDEAERELLISVKSGGDQMKEAHRLLAIIYSARGDKSKAIEELETYLRLAPEVKDAEQLRNVIQRLKTETPSTLQSRP